tara:strand:+ start:1953 stop:2243 length:291 start_codon:yes stop_codon:yes gene_type:complete
MAEQAYQRKPGSGSIFKNDRKTEDWHADWRGKVLLPDGSEHYVDLYNNKSQRDGSEYFGLRIGSVVAASSSTESAPVHHSQSTTDALEAMEDDLPF